MTLRGGRGPGKLAVTDRMEATRVAMERGSLDIE